MVTTSVRNTKLLKIANFARLYYPHLTILQHFATKLWNITNFVMLFHAMMEFCLDLLRSKFWLIGEWSINMRRNQILLFVLLQLNTDQIKFRYLSLVSMWLYLS